jgi:hypothetical protein
MVPHQHITDEIRMIKINVFGPEPHVRDVAKRATHSFKKGERILAQPKKHAAGKSLFRAGWEPKHRSVGRRVFAKPAHDIEKEPCQLRLARELVNPRAARVNLEAGGPARYTQQPSVLISPCRAILDSS